MSTPRPDHPWYGRKNHVKTRRKPDDVVRDSLIDREIERAAKLERMLEDIDDLDGSLRAAKDPSYGTLVGGGLRRMPVRYESE